MATYEGASAKFGLWVNGTLFNSQSARALTISDEKDGETTFEIGESLKLTSYSVAANGDKVVAAEATVVFRGTITVNGVKYPVVEQTVGQSSYHYAVGVSRESALPAQISSALDTDPVTGKFTVCFFPGTLIATPSGERKVEDLVPGDPVLVENAGSVPATWYGRIARKLRRGSGFGRAVPVKWLGRQIVSTRFGPAERLMPVRFAAGSLGGGGGATPAAE